jgi:hypothetical protein
LEEKKSFKDIVKSRPESKGEDVEMGGVSLGQNDIDLDNSGRIRQGRERKK